MGAREDCGSAGQEARTTIFERLAGYPVGPDLACQPEDFRFIVTGKRPIDRQVKSTVDGREVVQRLRGHLRDAVAGDQAQRALRAGNFPCNTRHHAAIEQDAVALMRPRHNLALHSVEGNKIQAGRELVGRQRADQVLRHPARRITPWRGAAEKVHEGNVTATAHHLVRRHRGIEPAGKQRDQPATRDGGQTAGALHAVSVEQRPSRDDLNLAGHLGRVELDAHAGIARAQMFQHDASQLALQFHGAHAVR